MASISSFSSLFELLAGINIAFIAVNYVNNYTNIIANNVFQIEEFIENTFKELYEYISTIRANIQGVNLMQTEYSDMVDSSLREGERCLKILQEKGCGLKNDAMNKCDFKSFGSTCLWSFLFCFTALVFGGLEGLNREYVNDQNLYNCLFVFSILSMIYFLFCWVFQGKKNKIYHLLINRLSGSITLCIISLLISIVITLLFDKIINIDTQNYSVYIFILFAFIPTINFVVYIIPIFYKVNRIKAETKQFKINFEKNEIKVMEEDYKAFIKIDMWKLSASNKAKDK